MTMAQVGRLSFRNFDQFHDGLQVMNNGQKMLLYKYPLDELHLIALIKVRKLRIVVIMSKFLFVLVVGQVI